MLLFQVIKDDHKKGIKRKLKEDATTAKKERKKVPHHKKSVGSCSYDTISPFSTEVHATHRKNSLNNDHDENYLALDDDFNRLGNCLLNL